MKIGNIEEHPLFKAGMEAFACGENQFIYRPEKIPNENETLAIPVKFGRYGIHKIRRKGYKTKLFRHFVPFRLINKAFILNDDWIKNIRFNKLGIIEGK